jgi:hypothetical protein
VGHLVEAQGAVEDEVLWVGGRKGGGQVQWQVQSAQYWSFLNKGVMQQGRVESTDSPAESAESVTSLSLSRIDTQVLQLYLFVRHDGMPQL